MSVSELATVTLFQTIGDGEREETGVLSLCEPLRIVEACSTGHRPRIPDGGSHGRNENHSLAQRSAAGRRRLRDCRSRRKTVRARRPDENLALPLRPLRQQALLRRYPQGRWVYRRSPRPRSASAGTACAETVTPREKFNASA